MLLSYKYVANIAKKILKTNAPMTPHKIICFLFFGTKLAAIEPTITALSAVRIIVIKIIFVKIISSSIKILIYSKLKFKIQIKVVSISFNYFF